MRSGSSIYIQRRASATAAEGKVHRIQRWRAGWLAGGIYSIYRYTDIQIYRYTAHTHMQDIYIQIQKKANEESARIYS